MRFRDVLMCLVAAALFWLASFAVLELAGPHG